MGWYNDLVLLSIVAMLVILSWIIGVHLWQIEERLKEGVEVNRNQLEGLRRMYDRQLALSKIALQMIVARDHHEMLRSLTEEQELMCDHIAAV